MKPFALSLFVLALTTASAVAQAPTAAAPEPLYLKSAIYLVTMEDLQSDEAKRKYPPLKIPVPQLAQPTTESQVTAVQTANKAFFKGVQYLKAWNGQIKSSHLAVVTNAITADLKVDEEEARVMELLKSATPFTLSYVAPDDATFKPSPLSVNPRPDATSVERLKEIQQKGFVLETHQVMTKKLLTRENFGEWVKLFQGGGRDTQMALAILRRRFIVTAYDSNFGNRYSPIRNMVSEVNGWLLELPAPTRDPLKTAIYQDISIANAAMGDYKVADAMVAVLRL